MAASGGIRPPLAATGFDQCFGPVFIRSEFLTAVFALLG